MPNALEAHRAANAPQSAVAVRCSAGVLRPFTPSVYLVIRRISEAFPEGKLFGKEGS